jgi:hypothetical protein
MTEQEFFLFRQKHPQLFPEPWFLKSQVIGKSER